MPLMRMSHRKVPVRVATTKGLTYVFNPGQEVDVHPIAVEACQSFGAAFVNEAEGDELLKPAPEAPAIVTAEQRRAALFGLYDKMIADQEGHRSCFTTAGRPVTRYVAKKLGIDIDSKEVHDTWAEHRLAH